MDTETSPEQHDPSDEYDKERDERARVQLRVIQESLEDVGVALPKGSDDPADWLYLYRRSRILVRDADLPRVLDALEGRGEVDSALVNGVTRVVVQTDEELPAVLADLDRRLGPGVATPDHVLYVTAKGTCCPATEPLEPPGTAPLPAVNTVTTDGAGVFVSVVDTGWYADAATSPLTPWLAGVTGDPEVIDPANIHPYGGHGTFIAGAVRCQAPSAEVRVEGFLPKGGAVYESDIVVQLCEALALGPDIISLSAGARTRGDRPLVGFEVFWSNFLSQVSGTVLVAAAGNDSTRAPFWPAAFPWTIGVGAIDAAGNRSSYSNFGSWVDVYALGDDQVNAFPVGDYVAHEPPFVGQQRSFKGLAQWSGTSFATPVVAGMIAARMSRSGLSARLAADELLAEARANAIRGVGPVL
ncbi:hypothetical protein E8D34_10565 [Nocardioides sp. GY 10113]|uniref:S8 family peptidase n=1 Tax=Nocardioides sp. GY 10113 TaxID=2569761 RepID=UPI0010A7594C|nr:S8 family serine peptidase [Nocardioides sp. GY 10113]TIC87547.1 hypothetical protein E8D34_10565 [Nocardioides sp. GY 10113]